MLRMLSEISKAHKGKMIHKLLVCEIYKRKIQKQKVEQSLPETS